MKILVLFFYILMISINPIFAMETDEFQDKLESGVHVHPSMLTRKDALGDWFVFPDEVIREILSKSHPAALGSCFNTSRTMLVFSTDTDLWRMITRNFFPALLETEVSSGPSPETE